MKIAIITPTLHYGGAERQVEFLATGLKQKGHAVTTYCFFDSGAIADILRLKDIKVINLYSWFIGKLYMNKLISLDNKNLFRKSNKILNRITNFANELWAASRLFFIFLKDKPDVVHMYQNQTKMAILVSKLCRVKKIIYTETSLIGNWFTPIQLSIMKFFWKFCDAVIVLSGVMREHMLSLNLVKESKLHLLPTMFPFNQDQLFQRESNDNSKVKVGIVGRLITGKGHIFFLEAANLISKRLNNVKFIIAGDGYLMEGLKKLTKELNLERNIEFLGVFQDIKEVMKKIDIFVLASLSEGMPLTLIEAMAYGKPIVATNVGGINELVKDGTTGFLVPAENSGALAEAIIKLIESPQKRQTFSTEVFRRYRDVYSAEKIISEIELLYRA